MSNFKKTAASLLLAIFMCVSYAPYANATTYYYPPTYQTQNNDAQIQMLLNQIYALMAQLQALQTTPHYVYPPTVPVVTYPPYTYHGSYDVEVSSSDYDVENDNEVTLTAAVDLNGASFANVWFEYGQDGDLDEDSTKTRVTSNRTVSIMLSNLDEGDRYYFRAVAEDPSGSLTYGPLKAFETDGNSHNSNGNDPEASTNNAQNINDDSAQLYGTVDMNDFDSGLVFFVYGEDESAIDDASDENSYNDIDSDGDNLQKITLSSNADGYRSFWTSVYGLDSDTDHYFRICVAYDDEDNDDALRCGDVENFTTDNN